MDEIATQMKRSKSTISRELRRNRIDGKFYLPDTAQSKVQTRRAQSKHKFMSIRESTLAQVKQRLEQYHSPEQCKGVNSKHGGIPGRIGIFQNCEARGTKKCC
jgi:transposase, IS30 family